MPTGWWEHLRDEYLSMCALRHEKPDPEWLDTWEKGGVLWWPDGVCA